MFGVDPRKTSRTPIDIVLPHERTVRGRAFDAAGKPFVHAALHAVAWDTAGDDVRREVTTGEDGTFEIPGLYADVSSLSVDLAVGAAGSWNGWKTLQVPQDSPPIDVQFDGERD